MKKRSLAIATTVALATVVVAAPARGATVSLRVDSSTDPAPLFDGSVTTLPHAVDGSDGSGPHPCTGPPGETPAPTATGALDDAMRGAGIAWRGNWDPSFRDFFVDRIGPFASAAPDRYWSLTVNGHFSSGGCLAQVEDGDAVHFSFGPLFGETAPAAAGNPNGATGPGAEGGSDAPASGPAAVRIRRLAAQAARYLRRHRDAVGAEWGRLALALRRGVDPSPAAAVLIRGRLGQLRHGSLGGDVNATATAVLALESRRPRAARRAARWLASVQDPSGGFGFRPRVMPDVDSTGLATWALAREGLAAAAWRGGAFVRSAQAADGGFPSLPGGVSNSQSTGLALVALRVSGIDPELRSPAAKTPLDFLSSLARANGSIAYGPNASPTPVWTTAQALLGLTSKARLIGTDTLRQPDSDPQRAAKPKQRPPRRRHIARAALGWRDH
ncbi:MAG TPA: prenyltransferase/squalene oxidase repeat-containing protein [Solirubrobacterales bacterium]|nr:prenyltransferase/squalene oxidase repeat-containing protein [Solirubrobacterales bacterium]